MNTLSQHESQNNQNTVVSKETAFSDSSKLETYSVLQMGSRIKTFAKAWESIKKRAKFHLNPELELNSLEKTFRQMKEIVWKWEEIPKHEKSFRNVLLPHLGPQKTEAFWAEVEEHINLISEASKDAQSAWEAYEENLKSVQVRNNFVRHYKLTKVYMIRFKKFIDEHRHYFEQFDAERTLKLDAPQTSVIELSTDI